ncbi:MAG: hypothetical protein JRN03_05070 [Nitrososphaerota archaeon]|nr:hypothetical protein [Nitrososphaerota archaeon]
MPTITVRISEDEKKRLRKHGALSKSVREALELYLSTRESDELIGSLEKLQRKNKVRTTNAEEVRLLNEDRQR